MEETIIFNEKTIAIIIRSDEKIENLKFFTPPEYTLQLGIHEKKGGVEIKPHLHNKVLKTISLTQEMLHVEYGKVLVEFFDDNQKKIAERILKSGDTMLQVEGGHGFKILDDSKIIEVKQGPYIGVEIDKKKL